MVDKNKIAKENIELLKKRIAQTTQLSKTLQEKLERFSCNHLENKEITADSIIELCSNFSLLDLKNEMSAIYETYYLIDKLQDQFKKISKSAYHNKNIEVKTTSFLPETDTGKLKVYGKNTNSCVKKFEGKAEKSPENMVDVCLDFDFFIVKTPHLLSVNNKKQNDFHNCFSEVLSKNIKEKLENHRVFLNQFAPKHITILQNHHCQEWNIVDNNNLDTKKILDAICEFCNGDAALTTSFLLVASRNFSIQDGCYFIVTKGYCSIKTMEEYQGILAKKFPEIQ